MVGDVTKLSRLTPPDVPVAIAAFVEQVRKTGFYLPTSHNEENNAIGRLARSHSGVPATLLRQGGSRDR